MYIYRYVKSHLLLSDVNIIIDTGSRRAARKNRDENFLFPEILFERISVIYRRIPAMTNRQT